MRSGDTGIRATDGRAPGFRPGRTLSVRTELRRQLGRLRTKVLLGFCVLLPIVLVIAFEIGSSGGGQDTADLIGLATRGAMNFTVFTLVMSVGFVLVVIVALCFGDTVASEASWSSLKYLLAIPIPRGRLLRQKSIVAGLISALAMLVLTTTAYLLGLIMYGAKPMTSPFGDAIDQLPAFGRLGIGLAYVALALIWVAGLALMLSVLTNAPLGAVGGAVMVSIVSQILDQITALGSLRNWLPGHFITDWTGVFSPTIDWNPMASGVLSSLMYGLVFTTIGAVAFRYKDITS